MYQQFDYQPHQSQLLQLFKAIEAAKKWSEKTWRQTVSTFPKTDGSLFAKDELVMAYRQLVADKKMASSRKILSRIRKKPVRTASGVSPVTVLTKPFPCPGKCIFCPNDIRMPKSYLADEPGAQRAERNYFDPYLQTYNRLQAMYNTGHVINKTEIIVLGGTWSYYPESYQIWFIKECFRALNDFGQTDDRPAVMERYHQLQQALSQQKAHVPSDDPAENKLALAGNEIDGEHITKSYNQVVSEIYTAPERLGGFDAYQSATWEELFEQHRLNERAEHRCVGLVVETRPDNISPAEVRRIRKLGCTKTQIGLQSLQDEVLSKNNRGHDVAASRRAIKLLRGAGFKIHAHWMANLYGSSVELDKQDYDQLFSDPDFRPDELKIYPCSLISSAELMQYHQRGEWQPYTRQQLLEVVSYALTHTPEYCRLTRVIRDIPGTDIVVGNKATNFRQIAQDHIADEGWQMQDIRAREVRRQEVDLTKAELQTVTYQTSSGTEQFLQYVIPQSNQPSMILAFLRLSLPIEKSCIAELEESAVIREIHVYGQAVTIGDDGQGKPQHAGFGKRLIVEAEKIAAKNAFPKLAVISAIGTRDYYRKLGFADGELYQFKTLSPQSDS